jgi:hypothetical protein
MHQRLELPGDRCATNLIFKIEKLVKIKLGKAYFGDEVAIDDPLYDG